MNIETKPKMDQHKVAAYIAKLVYAFRREYTDADRLLDEYAGCITHDYHDAQMNEKRDTIEDLESHIWELEGELAALNELNEALNLKDS